MKSIKPSLTGLKIRLQRVRSGPGQQRVQNQTQPMFNLTQTRNVLFNLTIERKMIMTLAELKVLVDAVMANPNSVEYEDGFGCWNTNNRLFCEEVNSGALFRTKWRIKPISKLRPFTRDESSIVVGAILTNLDSNNRWVAFSNERKGIAIHGRRVVSYTELAEHWKYSHDKGFTWKECGIMETQP